jgi:hypothetical protein
VLKSALLYQASNSNLQQALYLLQSRLINDLFSPQYQFVCILWPYMDADCAQYNGICAEGGNSDSAQELRSFLTLLKDCKEAVQGDLSSCKINNKQCEYLAGKLEEAVLDASSFIEEFRAKHHGPCSSEDVENIFKLVLALATQIKGFVRRCCDAEWIQAAMIFTNVSEYVTSLGLNVQLCKLAFEKARTALLRKRSVIRGFTFVELCELYKTEEEIVQIRASEDLYTLSNAVTMGLTSFCSKTKDIAIYLLQRLSGGEPCATSEDEGLLQKLYKFVTGAGQRLGKGATGTVYVARNGSCPEDI